VGSLGNISKIPAQSDGAFSLVLRLLTRRFAGLAAVLLLASAPAFAGPALKSPISSLQQLPITVAQPYDETANGDAQFAAAQARAKASHKRLLIDLGGNWCIDCIVLANFMHLPAISGFVHAHYEVVPIDVGRFDKNLQIPARFGFKDRLKGVPMVLIVTPEGKLVNGNDVFATSDAHTMTPQTLADYLVKYSG
jgi:hypothetical protein